MNHDMAVIEGVFDIILPKVPTSLHRWGRVVWLQDIEVGAKGKFLSIENGRYSSTHLSRITNIIKTRENLEIHTENSIYKLRVLPRDTYGSFMERGSVNEPNPF